MKYRNRLKQWFLCGLGWGMACCPLGAAAQLQPQVTRLAEGVVSLQFGEKERLTPYQVLKPALQKEMLEALGSGEWPWPLEEVEALVNERGCQLHLPLDSGEELYGFGLQIETMRQRGLRKTPVVNDYPAGALGYTHAPQTFYISSKGYGVLVNTSRQVTFLCGTHKRVEAHEKASATAERGVALSTEALYQNRKKSNAVSVDIPGARGVELILLAGPQVRTVVQRYNLLAGGGCLPPLWGLGLKYRMKGDAVQDSVLKRAAYFREKRIPCDVIGLEPGWQTHTYSCSYVWSHRFPAHRQLIGRLKADGYRVNLWEHAYVHPSSPLYGVLKPYAGNYEVWDGLVPDFLMPEARTAFAGYHREFLEEGIDGFKLDECDNSNRADATKNWGFPDCTVFPSGADGAQMHQLFGSLYVSVMDSLFRAHNRRTWQDYRSSGLFMSSVPAVLYSDTYHLRDYIRMMCTAAFGGLLWCPEVREAASATDFFHRLQTVILSPQALVNAWYLEYAPWLQFDTEKNNRGEFLPEAAQYEAYSRQLIEQRMQLIPYLYAAFAKYRTEGLPPFRPLLMDNPEDAEACRIDDQYLLGDGLMAAPLYGEGNTRRVYFPKGRWFHWQTNRCWEGGRYHEVTVAMNELPLFVREGTLLPLAEPVQQVNRQTVFRLHVKAFGDCSGRTVCLWEDDGETYDFEKGAFNRVELRVDGKRIRLTRRGAYPEKRYRLVDWEFVH